MGALISGERRLELAAMGERAARAATGLLSLGIREGDLIALYLRNDFPFFEASGAASLLGAYPTPVNWHYTPDEARYLFENSGAKAIVIPANSSRRRLSERLNGAASLRFIRHPSAYTRSPCGS